MSAPEHHEVEVDLFGDPIAPPDPGAATRGRRGAVAAAQWQAWLNDADLVARYRASIHWRGPSACAYWLSSISSSGHGKFRLGSHTDDSRRVVTAHLIGYQLHRGVLPDALGDVVIGHTCDEPSCQNVFHMEVISRAENDADYRRRKNRWPLSDVRGAQGRALALREAIRSALDNGSDVESALGEANAAGRPHPPADTLF
ncbi:hypothetical protein [Nocardiopsis sp. JB363]|uniref:hypothetical protein n=1 Tax=Nocardiopsis sp. JB363 TaxID=1434837 RepID=UPI00097A35F6|nr:hypothetical protein [Nocardiopsis sp. JB363]SIO87455.1 hypothetical protein BQ8420_16580 [Nocardiopsis sp. JB363]